MRHQFSIDESIRGGKLQPKEAKVRGGQRGFQVTMEKHPFMARKYLRHAKGMKKESGRFSPK